MITKLILWPFTSMWKLTGFRVFFLLLFSIVSCFTLFGDEVIYWARISRAEERPRINRSLFFYAPSTRQSCSVTEQDYDIFIGNGPSEIITYCYDIPVRVRTSGISALPTRK